MTAAAPARARRVAFHDLRDLHALDGVQERVDAAVLRVARSGRYLLGPELSAFEEEFARYCENDHCVGVGSGLDALELTLRALEVGPGDEVIVPGHTYIATWLAVSAVGARPVPVEPEADSYLMDPQRLADAITPRTRAVMPVHPYGHPADLDAIDAVAAARGIPVLEDAAQAHGARYRGRRAGARYAAAFSFYPGKNLGALGDAGAVVTSDARLAERVRLLRNYGSRVKYRHEVPGRNSRLDEIQAAALRVKLPYLDRWNARRAEVAARYTEGLAGLPGLAVPAVRSWAEPVWHQYVVRAARRASLVSALEAAGVETLVHYPVAVHRSEAYAGAATGPLPRCERLADEVLSLPMGPQLTAQDVTAVIAAVREATETSHD
ncbi:DegT/DnrJ/EryC1/StrS family aminotransferase [Streptomyces sp. DH41]|uniref:DegT/DnrJ/EryC1/StrS family aminotransferase n=1 Tax=Streptomyces sp. DH41 TaxID=3040125 RepID=UPI002441C781|nr:DegT/DnrJ/EryC1/StrS family aminotransferase [Streptomyces sp. DH41]MDG9723676.1 DegT/DnrJ/EryC1/StrS family aminotransferase [Streptomyces sp. DH41]